MDRLSKETPLTVGMLIELLERSACSPKLLATLRAATETDEERSARELDEFDRRSF